MRVTSSVRVCVCTARDNAIIRRWAMGKHFSHFSDPVHRPFPSEFAGYSFVASFVGRLAVTGEKKKREKIQEIKEEERKEGKRVGETRRSTLAAFRSVLFERAPPGRPL